MSYFNIVAQTNENTVVTEYKPQDKRSDAYQSEAQLEAEFIRLLVELGYERLAIHKEKDLIENLRHQLEKLNDYQFTDDEWNRLFTEVLDNSKDGIVEKTRLIQEDHVQVLRRDNGESKNIMLIDKKCIHNNSVQVINQYVVSTEDGAKHDNRYDVTILVNGLPLIHIELKRRGVHALRHTFATLWVQRGQDVRTLSEILGHTNVAFTMQKYVHSDTETKKRGMAAMSDII